MFDTIYVMIIIIVCVIFTMESSLGCVHHDQKLWDPTTVLTYNSGVSLIYQRIGGVQTVRGCVHLKYPLELSKRDRLSPGSGFLSVADVPIKITKGDVKHQPTN